MPHIFGESTKQQMYSNFDGFPENNTAWFGLFFFIMTPVLYVPGSINSHYFHIIGDGHQPKSVGVYMPIIRIPIKGGMTIPNTRSLDCGTYSCLFV